MISRAVMSMSPCGCKKCKPKPPGCAYMVEKKDTLCPLCAKGQHEKPRKSG